MSTTHHLESILVSGRFPEISDLICQSLDIYDFVALSKTCKGISGVYKAFEKSAFNIGVYLSQYVNHPRIFLSKLDEFHGFVVGFAAACFFYRTGTPDVPLTILLPHRGKVEEFCNYLCEIEGLHMGHNSVHETYWWEFKEKYVQAAGGPPSRLHSVKEYWSWPIQHRNRPNFLRPHTHCTKTKPRAHCIQIIFSEDIFGDLVQYAISREPPHHRYPSFFCFTESKAHAIFGDTCRGYDEPAESSSGSLFRMFLDSLRSKQRGLSAINFPALDDPRNWTVEFGAVDDTRVQAQILARVKDHRSNYASEEYKAHQIWLSQDVSLHEYHRTYHPFLIHPRKRLNKN